MIKVSLHLINEIMKGKSNWPHQGHANDNIKPVHSRIKLTETTCEILMTFLLIINNASNGHGRKWNKKNEVR